MKDFNLFWLIVWALILAFAIVALFWKPAIFFVIVIAAIFVVLFFHDYRESKGR